MERGHETIEDFEAFLSQTGLVRKDKIKYYAYWVNKFLNYSKYRSNKPMNQNIPSYLEKLEKDERIKAALPYALSQKYPNANKEWDWQWEFPSKNLSVDPVSKKIKCPKHKDIFIATQQGY